MKYYRLNNYFIIWQVLVGACGLEAFEIKENLKTATLV